MLPPSFDYVSPKTLSEAVSILGSREGAKVLAGGQSFIPLLKLRLASPTLVVDINRLPGLDYVQESGGSLRLGALTRIATLESSQLIQSKYPIIHDASAMIADPLVRNLGTVGGNISHGDPTNDLPAVMLALGGEFVATGPTGTRNIKAGDFFLDTFTVALNHDEILTEVRCPMPAQRSGGSYLKVEQKVADFATAGAAVYLWLDSKGACEKVGIGLTAVGPKAIKADKAEESLLGQKPTDVDAVKLAARLASESADPVSDVRGSADYKRSLLQMLVSRAVKAAALRAKGRGAK